MTVMHIATTLPDDLEHLIRDTIGCCLEVHKTLGPGMNETVYSRACAIELTHRKIPFDEEKTVPIRYRGQLLCHQRIDLLVDDRLIVEIKSVEKIHPVHVAQAVSYLRATRNRAALVINFNVEMLRQGIRRVVL